LHNSLGFVQSASYFIPQSQKACSLTRDKPMYIAKDHQTKPLFENLFPFGGKLDDNNRWLIIADLIPWTELENKYSQLFSYTGRPACDAHLVIGLLLLKHLTGTSDRDIVQTARENPYMQAFCGIDNFNTGKQIHSSTLTNVRKRLGRKLFKELEDLTYKHLIQKKIIKAKGLLVDATVFPENIRYPTDAGLLNEARQWLVKKITSIGGKIGRKHRTYCRKARQEYLLFNKRKRKTNKDVRHIVKSMLQYVRRNVRQLEETLTLAVEKGIVIHKQVTDRLTVIKTLLQQQWRMHREKVNRIDDRIEGAIGHVKNHYGLERIKYSIESGDELWVRLGLLAANLKTAASKA